MELPDPLLAMALDLTASLAGKDRLARVLESVRGALPCDAAAVLELVGDELVPLATHGLAPEVLGRRFARREHPRLDLVLARRAPVRFAADSALPDPYDGLLLANPDATRDVHACLGCPLLAGENVIGVLTADALEPGAFDQLDERFLRMWRLYLLGSQAAFNVGELQLFQVVFAPGRNNQIPWTRADIYQPNIHQR